MNVRNVVLGLAVVFGLSFYSWCRPCQKEIQQPQASEVPVIAEGFAGKGNHDEAVARFRTNQSRHWRQVAMGH